MTVENNGINRASVIDLSLAKSGNSLKNLSEKLKKDETLGKIYGDSVDIRNSDAAITTRVRTVEDAEKVIAATKLSIDMGSAEALMAHSKLSM